MSTIVHGHAAKSHLTPTYQSWQTIHHRSKGEVCARWKSFVEFLRDLGMRPPGKKIGRKDASKPWTRANTRWVTTAEENRNRKNVRKYRYRNQQWTAGQLAELCGVADPRTLAKRIERLGVEEAVRVSKKRRTAK